MRINDVEKITGLTAKAIRLYEGKGLITVARDGNGYRNYSDKNVEDLKTVRLLRSVGASLTDIKLLLFGVIDIGELMEKRKAEILKESGSNSERYRLCLDIAEKGCACIEGDTAFTEGEEGAADTDGVQLPDQARKPGGHAGQSGAPGNFRLHQRPGRSAQKGQGRQAPGRQPGALV